MSYRVISKTWQQFSSCKSNCKISRLNYYQLYLWSEKRLMIADETYTLRLATIDGWIEETVEMPFLFDKHQLSQMIGNAIPLREVWVIGEPVNGFKGLAKEKFKIIPMLPTQVFQSK